MRLLLVISVLVICSASIVAQTDTSLRDELLKMREADQKAREECAKGNADEQIKCLVETLEKIDKPHLKRLEEIFQQTGFPTRGAVGKDGVEAFLLILQHAPDETLRQKCLKPITKAFRRKEISPMDYANYVDRLLVRQGKPQIYGSNFDLKEGRLVMSAVRDRKKLDRRRRKIGLSPIAEYAAKLKEVYNLEVEIPE